MIPTPPTPPTPLGESPHLAPILAFLESIGIEAVAASDLGGTLLPGMTVRDGQLLYDPAAPGWPADLLHEAGHLAVADPAQRDALAKVGDDPAEEMATLAWSYAAAIAIGLPIDVLFHSGYKGGPDYLIAAFGDGIHIGLPMLHYWGMAWRQDEPGPPFPAMRSWFRPAALPETEDQRPAT